jgi:hypothetical protein
MYISANTNATKVTNIRIIDPLNWLQFHANVAAINDIIARHTVMIIVLTG